MSLPTTAATTLENLKKYLNIAANDTSKDDFLELLIEAATNAAEDYLGRYIVARQITQEPYDCTNSKSKYLQLRQYPVTTITAILEDGETVDTSAVTADNTNGIIKRSIFWKGAVLVTYTAGIASSTANVPKNLQLAIWQWISSILNTQGSQGINSETLGDYSVSYIEQNPIPRVVQSLLEGYRRVDL